MKTKPADAWITLKQAKFITEAEIARRRWGGIEQWTYQRSWLKTGDRWLCRGFAFGLRGGMMVVEID